MAPVDDVPRVEDVDPEEFKKLQVQEGNEENKDASNTVDEDDEVDISGPKASRGDKKTRKLVAKLGLTAIEPVRRVVMKQSDRLVAFDSPDVYKLGTTYVVFGDAKVEDLNQAQKQAQAASQFRAPPNPQSTTTGETETNKETEEEGQVGSEGFEEKDIEMCMSQANCSRAKAVEVLKKNNGDVVNSIMELSN